MKESLVESLQDPVSGEAVELETFETGKDSLGDPSIIEGLLYSPNAGNAFPIIQGVPMMIPRLSQPTF
jgi:uncharacterized protein YbaR (Trm112 family)